MSARLTAGLRAAMRAIAAGDVGAGMAALLTFMEEEEPGHSAWAGLRGVDFVKDAAGVSRQLRARFSAEALAEFSHFYFGLDDLNMPAGKGIEFGCGRSKERYERYPKEISSPALARIFGAVDGNLVQYVLGIGYLGLALNGAFKALAEKKKWVAGQKSEIEFGFHDGDLFLLGTIDADGFRLGLDAKYLRSEEASEVPSAKMLRGLWPVKSRDAGDWYLAAAYFVMLSQEKGDRWQHVFGHLDKLCDKGRAGDAAAIHSALAQEGVDGVGMHVRVRFHLVGVRIGHGLKNASQAKAHLRAAQAVCDSVEDSFWRERFRGKIFQCATSCGMGRAVAKLTAEERWELDFEEAVENLKRAIRSRATVRISPAKTRMDGVLKRRKGGLPHEVFETVDRLYAATGDERRRKKLRGLPREKGDFMWELTEDIEAMRREESVMSTDARFAEVERESALRPNGKRQASMAERRASVTRLEVIVEELLRGGNVTELQRVLPRIEAIMAGWEFPEVGGFSSEVHRTLGRWLHRGGFVKKAAAAFARSERAALGETTISVREREISKLAEAYVEIQEWEGAARCVGLMRDPLGRRMELAKVYLRAGRWKELKEVLGGVRRAEEAGDVAMQLAWVLDEGK